MRHLNTSEMPTENSNSTATAKDKRLGSPNAKRQTPNDERRMTNAERK